jgi:hypothetical protein
VVLGVDVGTSSTKDFEASGAALAGR